MRKTGWSSEMYDRLDPVICVIRDRSAMSITDLAAKAMATATMHPDLWEKSPEELDYEKRLLRDLIENACVLAGASLPPMLSARRLRRLN